MTTRLSVTLEAEDERIVEDFGTTGTPERLALLEWAGDNGLSEADLRSDAALLRALLRAGAESVRARALDLGYSALAVSYSGEEHDEGRVARRAYQARTEAAAGP